MSATSTFDHGWWHQHAHGTNKIYRKNPEHLAMYKQWRREESRREAIKTAKPIESLLHWNTNCAHCATVRAPTALPARQELYGCGMILQDAIRSSGGGRRRKRGMEVDPTLADEEQLDEDISILEEGPAPDLEYL
jgi:hypothetical protein